MAMIEIPATGSSRADVLERLEAYRAKDLNWRSGRTWGYVYHAGQEAEEVAKAAYMAFLSENALDFTVYPSVMQLETELVSMASAHLHGDDEVVGNFTSGGTESIILAVKTARDAARATRPEVERPEMVLPITAHAAFHKAAHYLGLETVSVPVDPRTYTADVDAVRQAITPDTILLVASAPSYAHGVVDPIAELGQLALEHDLLLHVDACIGGFLLPYFKRLGSEVTDFDFRVPGVTSISMDLHKYAYAPKGASIVLYRDKRLRKHQIFSCAQWTGYTVVNTTVQSTKSAGPMAAAWAVLSYLGDDGYLELARGLRDATNKILDHIDKSDDLYVMGTPEMSLIAFASDTINVFHLADEMKERGWYIQAQLAYGPSKENIHLTVNPSNLGLVDAWLEDLQTSIEAVKGLPSGQLAATISGVVSSMETGQLSDEMFVQMLAMAGIDGVELPDKMAEINEVLNALPPAFKEQLLTAFVNDLFRYRSR